MVRGKFMNKLKAYFMKPVSAPLASVILILFCLACSCPRTNNERVDKKTANTTPPKPTIPSSQVNTKPSNRPVIITPTPEEEDYPDNNDSTPKPSSDSSDSYFIGNWKVSQANAYIPEYKPLTITSNGTYSWEEPVSKETFSGKWRMENGALILERAYKGADWRIKVFKPENESGTNKQIWINGIGDGMGFYEYKGFRVE